jgi:hypothetical protein
MDWDSKILNSDGSTRDVVKGEFVTIEPGQLMRRSAAVEVLMPQGVFGEQFQK